MQPLSRNLTLEAKSDVGQEVSNYLWEMEWEMECPASSAYVHYRHMSGHSLGQYYIGSGALLNENKAVSLTC